MSQLTDMYEESDKLRVKQAREEIPGKGVDFFDRDAKFSEGFKTGQRKGDESAFTEEAVDHYNTEKAELTPPDSFDTSKPLHRYTPENKFHEEGKA